MVGLGKVKGYGTPGHTGWMVTTPNCETLMMGISTVSGTFCGWNLFWRK